MKSKKLTGVLDFGLDLYRIEVADGEGIEFHGRIDFGKRIILVAPQSDSDLATTMVHEILHYADDKYANNVLQRADPDNDACHHPTLDLFSRGLTAIFVRNWPFWRKVFDNAHKAYLKEKA